MKKELLIGIALILVAVGCAALLFVSRIAVPASPVMQGCTLEAKICPDGTAVGRTGPNCEFAACPMPTSTAPGAEGKSCGGIAAFPCPNGYVCKLDGTFPDAGGHCTAATGIVSGKATIAPVCPVERPGVMCAAPSAAYTSRQIIVYDESGQDVITTRQFNGDGTYSIVLPEGDYVIDIGKNGIDRSDQLPKSIHIAAHETTTVDFNIDIGIR